MTEITVYELLDSLLYPEIAWAQYRIWDLLPEILPILQDGKWYDWRELEGVSDCTSFTWVCFSYVQAIRMSNAWSRESR